MKGTVKFFNRVKGFGFITAEDGSDYFVHYSNVEEGTRLQDNDPVVFDVEQGERGPKAVNVKLDQGGDSAPAAEPAQEEAPAEEPAPAEEEPAQEAPAEESAEEEKQE